MVVDTSLFIEHLRSKDRSKSLLANFPVDTMLFISSITVFELYCGAIDNDKKRDVQILLQDIPELPLTYAVAEKAGEIYRYLRSTGKMIEVTDILIAATALEYGMPVKTLNTNHFERIPGLILV